MDFIKYQSLENDFIIFDLYTAENAAKEIALESHKVQKLCARYTGIGADGILCIRNNPHINLPTLTLFNSNGEQAELCLNGLRCAAHYLFKYQKFPNSFLIMMNEHAYKCELKTVENVTLITTYIPKPVYKGKIKITASSKTFNAHSIDMGNPHAVLFEPTSDAELLEIGPLIENNENFPNKTNVEFIWRDKNQSGPNKKFIMKVFERHCGLTRSCSSGAGAALQALLEEHSIAPGEKVEIEMPGGILECSIDSEKEIVLIAPAFHVFSGVIE